MPAAELEIHNSPVFDLISVELVKSKAENFPQKSINLLVLLDKSSQYQDLHISTVMYFTDD
jgi:hypothetical protein